MTPSNRPSTDPAASPALSTGLGGPLWLFAWVLAVLPLVLTTESIAHVWRYPPILDPGDYLYLLHNTTLVWHLLLLIALWRAALLFFRRAAGFPASWWLLAALLWLGLIATQVLDSGLRGDAPWRWSMLLDGMSTGDGIFLFAPVALAMYLGLSPHARRAFRSGGAATWGPPWAPDVLRHGPDDWSRGVWLIPGLLLQAGLLHASGAIELAADAMKPLPAPERHAVVYMALSAFESREHLQATRLQWGLYLLALSLWPVACHAFVRRRPRTFGLVVALLAVTIAAPVPWIIIDPPPIYADGPDHEAQLLKAIVLALIVLPALWSARRRGRFGRAPEAVPGAGAGPDAALSGGARDSDR